MVAFALGHPGYGPAHIASELPRPKWGGFTIFSQRRLARPAKARHRHPGAQVRPAGRLCSPAGAGPRAQTRAPHRGLTPRRTGADGLLSCIGRLAGTKGVVWQDTAIDAPSSFCWAKLHTALRNPDVRFSSGLARRRGARTA